MQLMGMPKNYIINQKRTRRMLFYLKYMSFFYLTNKKYKYKIDFRKLPLGNYIQLGNSNSNNLQKNIKELLMQKKN